MQAIQDIFFRGSTYHAKAKNSQGTISYFPVEGAPTEEEIALHLSGEICLGSYTLLPDSTCRWICWDVDSTDIQKARVIAQEISEKLNTTPHGIEFSGNKGYHIWIFLTEPVGAERLKLFGTKVREAVNAPTTGDPHVEFFPKQERLTSSSPLGNLVKVPLGLHPKTHARSMFVDIHNGWESGYPIDPQIIFGNLVSFTEIETQIEEADPLTKMITLLVPYWTDGERHHMALNLAGFLSSLGWAKETTDELVTELVETAGGDINNLLECVETTYGRLARGLSVQGFSGLTERLPVNVMRQLSDLAGQNIANAVVQIIDRMRLDKGAPFLKVRSVERAVCSHLMENGKFVRHHEELYWLDHTSHKLLLCEGTAWNALFRQRFGLNCKEAFSSQVQEGVRLESWSNAAQATIHKHFYWDGVKLWINFGGAEVYCLNGNPQERKLYYNGDQNFLFASNEQLDEDLRHTNLLTAEAANPWDFLVEDVNFAATVNIAATNEQQKQMLKAWILQVFFGEIMHTRPIGIFLGVRGSGKTTAARRILRFFEGFHQDVLGLAEDKPDSLRASIEQHLILVLDNLERTKAKWLDNYLNRLSTGAQIELRRLHKTNEQYIIRPDVFVLGTGIEIPSSEESLYSRILPLEMDALVRPKPEHYMQTILRDNFIGAWAGMLNLLDSVIVTLRQNTTIDVPTNSRLADFMVFCQRIKNSSAVNGELLLVGMNQLVQKQHNLMGQTSPAVEAVELWLADWRNRRLIGADEANNPENYHTSGDIYKILKQYATHSRLEGFRWNTPAGFSKHFIYLVESLKQNYGLELRTVRNSTQGRDEQQYRFPRTTLQVA